MLNNVAYLAEPRKFIFLDEDVPSPNLDEVILKIKVSGVCSSEIPFYTGDVINVTRMQFFYSIVVYYSKESQKKMGPRSRRSLYKKFSRPGCWAEGVP